MGTQTTTGLLRVTGLGVTTQTSTGLLGHLGVTTQTSTGLLRVTGLGILTILIMSMERITPTFSYIVQMQFLLGILLWMTKYTSILISSYQDLNLYTMPVMMQQATSYQLIFLFQMVT